MKKGKLCLALLLAVFPCHHAAGVWPKWMPPSDRQLSNGIVTAITQDTEGYVWIGTRRGLNRYNGSVFTPYFESDSLSLTDDNIVALFPNDDGSICVIESSGIDTLRGGRVTGRMRSANVRCAARRSTGGILIGADDGLWLLEADAGSLRHVTDDDATVCGSDLLAVSGRGDVWCLDGGGLGISVLDSTFSPKNEIPIGNGVAVNGLLPFGQEGMLCARSDGLRLYSAEGEELALHPRVLALTQGRDCVFVSMDEALDRVAVGVRGYGMFSFDMEGGGIERIWADETLDQSGEWLCFISEEAVWLSNSHAGLRFRPRERNYNRLGLSFLQGGDEVQGIHGLSGDYVLIVSRRQAFVQNIRDGGYRDVTPPDWPGGIRASRFDAERGELWAYTDNEALKYSLLGLSVSLVERRVVSDVDSLAVGGGQAGGPGLDAAWRGQSCVAVSADGTLWVGTDGNGLLHLSAGGSLMGAVTEADWLADNKVRGVYADESGVWACGRQTVTNHDGVQATVYDFSMDQDEFVSVNPVLQGGRWLVFPCQHSLVVFDTKNDGGKRPYKIDIDDVLAGNVRVPFEGGELRLSHRVRQLVVYFSGMGYDMVRRPSYQYRLDGHDRDWVDAGQSTRAAYTSLRPGRYTFRVRMRFRSEDWSDEEATFSLRIDRSPWLSAWACIAYALALAALLAVLSRLLRQYRNARSDVRDLTDIIDRNSQQMKRLSGMLTTPSPHSGVAAQSEAMSGLSPRDRKFVETFISVIDRNLDKEDFKVSDLPDHIPMNRSTIFLKVKELFGVSPQEFILNYRLSRAAYLLMQGDKNVSEVAYSVGFGTLNGFSKAFKAKFGVSPSKWAASNAANDHRRCDAIRGRVPSLP